MEHGFGGMFMIRILIVFVFIYVMFIGIALNIAKAYRIKNGVINILEQYQYDMNDDSSGVLDQGNNEGLLCKYLGKIPYTVDQNNDTKKAVNDFCEAVDGAKDANGNVKYRTQTGVCIVQIGDESFYHYKVYVFMVVDFPLFGLNNKLIPVSGETITMS